MQANLQTRKIISVPGHLPRSQKLFNDGRHIVSILGEAILVTDLEGKNLQRIIRGHDDFSTCLAVANHANLIATGQVGNNSDVLVWDFAQGKILFRLSEHDYEVSCVEFSHNDRLLLSIGNFMDKRLFVWDNLTGFIVGSKALEEVVVCAAWGGMVRDIKWRDTDNYRFAVCFETSLSIWELEPQSGNLQCEYIPTGSSKREFKCITFSPTDQRLLIAGTKSADFFVINMKTKTLQDIIRLGNLGVTCVTTTATDGIIFGCGDGTFSYYRVNQGEVQPVDSINLGKKITSLSCYGNEVLVGVDYSQALMINLKGLQPAIIQEAHKNVINYVKFFDGDSNNFASASADGSIRFWDANTFQVKARIYSDQSIPATCLHVRDEIIISGWKDGSLRMHEVSSQKQIWEICNTHKNGIESLELSRDTRLIATGGGDGVARVWELRSRSMISNLKEHAARITKVRMLPGDKMMITSSRDKSLLLWDIEQEKRLTAFCLSMGGVNSFDFVEESGMLISTGQDRKITFWDLRSPTPQNTVNTDSNIDISEECYSLRIKNTADSFFTSGSGNFVKLWDIREGKLIDKKPCHSKGIGTIDISHDGKTLVSGGFDYSIGVWDI